MMIVFDSFVPDRNDRGYKVRVFDGSEEQSIL